MFKILDLLATGRGYRVNLSGFGAKAGKFSNYFISPASHAKGFHHVETDSTTCGMVQPSLPSLTLAKEGRNRPIAPPAGFQPCPKNSCQFAKFASNLFFSELNSLPVQPFTHFPLAANFANPATLLKSPRLGNRPATMSHHAHSSVRPRTAFISHELTFTGHSHHAHNRAGPLTVRPLGIRPQELLTTDEHR